MSALRSNIVAVLLACILVVLVFPGFVRGVRFVGICSPVIGPTACVIRYVTGDYDQ